MIVCKSAACCRRHPRATSCDGGDGRQADVVSRARPSTGRHSGNQTASEGPYEGALARLYSSSRALDVGPQPISTLELEQGAKLIQAGPRWIRRFDAQHVQSAYFERFAHQQRAFEEHIAGEAVLCIGARLGGEGERERRVYGTCTPRRFSTMHPIAAVRALTQLGALAIGVDFNPGFRNPYVLWGDGLRLQFANSTFQYVYTNVLDHVPQESIPTFLSEARRVLKRRGTLWLDIDAHPPDRYAHSSIAQQARIGAKSARIDAVASLRAAGFTVVRTRPFCTSLAQLHRAATTAECLRGNPTANGGIDPLGGLALTALAYVLR